MSLTTGTTNMETKNNLSAAEICRIIKQCHASEVMEFSYQGVNLKFLPRRNGDAEMPGQATDHNSTSVVSEFQATGDQAQLMDNEALLEAEEAQLLIDDPSAFERSQIDRHIERARAYEGI